ncbi:MAG: hypothetical protein GF401_08550 [Chitinivibrionales bacterium]|nr:hypothetical protein [Chitinivibrionales bacterium]
MVRLSFDKTCVSFFVVCVFANAFSLKEEVIRKHFEWGEYDSLVVKLQPYFSSLAEIQDSAQIAEYHLYYAVAEYAKGKISESRVHFIKAYALNPEIECEKKYVNEEILDLFAATIDEYKRQITLKAKQDSLLLEKEERLEQSKTKLEIIELKKQKRNKIIGAAIGYTLACAAAVFAVSEYNKAERYYDIFETARTAGDKAVYDEYKFKTKKTDALTIAASMASAVAAGMGAAFTFTAQKERKTIRDLQSQSIGAELIQYGIQISVEF